jgi:hypothetical protein
MAAVSPVLFRWDGHITTPTASRHLLQVGRAGSAGF